MVEVLHKAKHYKIQCNNCRSILKYDEFDELGKEEYQQKVREEQSKLGYHLGTPIGGELYIWCPICKNKVATTKLYGSVSVPMGTEI